MINQDKTFATFDYMEGDDVFSVNKDLERFKDFSLTFLLNYNIITIIRSSTLPDSAQYYRAINNLECLLIQDIEETAGKPNDYVAALERKKAELAELGLKRADEMMQKIYEFKLKELMKLITVKSPSVVGGVLEKASTQSIVNKINEVGKL